MPFAVAAHRIALENPLVQFDPDTRDFIMRVERADGQALETSVRRALDAFVRGCKADGIWDAIKACCIMMGARTLAGALVPLKGSAPTNFNFVSGDYDRKTGLIGNATTKYLGLNVAFNSYPQNNRHISVLPTVLVGTDAIRVAVSTTLGTNGSTVYHTTGGIFNLQIAGSNIGTGRPWVAGSLVGGSRSSASEVQARTGGTTTTHANTSVAPSGNAQFMYSTSTGFFSGSRYGFYSLGESLDLALLDARVTALRNAIATSIDGVTDPDARAYINAVEAADGQTLEVATAQAIGNFIVGCKADGIWDAIKACCIMMGARTLAGALVALKGTAPTNFNFVSGDYDRKTGLVGNGTTKYLDSNRNNNADPQNNYHLSVFASTANTTANRQYIGAGGSTGAAGATHFNLGVSSAMGMRNRSSTFDSVAGLGTSTGFLGLSRSSAASYSYRFGGSAGTQARTSSTPFNGNVQIFANEGASIAGGRLSYYSIGESLNLTLLDARVTALSNAISTAF